MNESLDQDCDTTVVISDDEGPVPSIDTRLDAIFRSLDSSSKKRRKSKNVATDEKTTKITANEILPATNKGFIMLQKMGYELGSGLGRCNNGIVEPISVDGVSGRLGLGHEDFPDNFGQADEGCAPSDRDFDNYFVMKRNESKGKATGADEGSWDDDQDQVITIVEEDSIDTDKINNISNEMITDEPPAEAETTVNLTHDSDELEEELLEESVIFKARIILVRGKTKFITDWQYRVLLTEIQKAVDRLEINNEKEFPRFHSFKLRKWYILVCCDNRFSLNWLTEHVSNFDNIWENAKLRVVEVGQDTDSQFYVEAKVKSCYTNGYILRRIMKQNPDLDTTEWHIDSTENDGSHKILRLKIDEKSYDVLTKFGFEIFFNLWKIRLTPNQQPISLL